MVTLNVPAVALLLSALGFFATLVTSIVIVTWRFSSLTVRLEHISKQLEEALRDSKTAQERTHTELADLDKRLSVLEARVDNLEKDN